MLRVLCAAWTELEWQVRRRKKKYEFVLPEKETSDVELLKLRYVCFRDCTVVTSSRVVCSRNAAARYCSLRRITDLERKLREKPKVVFLERDEEGSSGKVVMRAVLPDEPGAHFICRLNGEVYSNQDSGSSHYNIYLFVRLGGTRIWPRTNEYFRLSRSNAGSPLSWAQVVTVEAGKSDEQRTIEVVLNSSCNKLYKGAVLEIAEI